MRYDRYNRECAEKITINETGKSYTLTYIGSGSFCIVYKTDSWDIIKEFCPIIGERVTMSRKEGKNSPFTKIESLSETDSRLVDERYAEFLSEESRIKALNRAFREKKNNMIIVPNNVETSLGVCQWCTGVEGQTLDDLLLELKTDRASEPTFKSYFSRMLPYVIRFFNQIQLYHDNGFLNLDVKPDNLFAFSVDDYVAIRNIDFGSTKNIKELIREIRSHRTDVGRDRVIAEIAESSFACSAPYYSTRFIKETVELCLDSECEEEMERALMQLDVRAAFKTFMYAVSELSEKFLDDMIGEVRSEGELMDELFCKTFADKSFSGSLFSDYDVYMRLYEISGRVFAEPEYNLTAREISEKLSEVLSIIDEGYGQTEASAINHALAEDEELLTSRGLTSLSDILEFCEREDNLCSPELAGRLHWYLLFGEVREDD